MSLNTDIYFYIEIDKLQGQSFFHKISAQLLWYNSQSIWKLLINNDKRILNERKRKCVKFHYTNLSQQCNELTINMPQI